MLEEAIHREDTLYVCVNLTTEPQIYEAKMDRIKGRSRQTHHHN